MITVGINRKVLLVGASINEKNSLELKFEELGNVKDNADIFKDLQTATVENDARVTTLLLFPFKKPTGQRLEGKTQEELLESVSKDMKKVKNQLTQILELWLTSDKIKWDPFFKTGVTNDNYRTEFMNDESLGKIFANYAGQFIQMAQPFFGDKSAPFRLKLVRQSADKHFATLPGQYLKDNPFVELEEIPEKDTKVKFTAWEIQNKYNDGTPVARPKDSEDMAPAGESAEGQPSVFGKRS